MKTILILGGSKYILPLIEKAHQLGLFVITCDYIPTNIAHKFSDLYINASVVDKEQILRIAKKYKVDGITSFACDPGVTTMAYVTNKLGLPSVGPYESVVILQNKNLFRNFLKNNGFNVPYSMSFYSYSEAEKNIDSFIFPVIVKPVDSAGSKGVTIIKRKEELKNAFDNAMLFSFTKQIIIEEFIEQIGQPSDSDCYSKNGILVYSSFSNQYFDSSCENPFVPAGFSWPSSMSANHKTALKRDLQRLLKLLKMQTSIYNMETRVGKDNKAYIMEVSPRGGGNRLAEMLMLYEKADLIEYHIKDCVGIPYQILFKRDKRKNKLFEIILHSKYDGTFEDVAFSKEISKKIIEKDIWVSKGSYIRGFKGANDAIGTIILKADKNDSYASFVNNIKVLLK